MDFPTLPATRIPGPGTRSRSWFPWRFLAVVACVVTLPGLLRGDPPIVPSAIPVVSENPAPAHSNPAGPATPHGNGGSPSGADSSGHDPALLGSTNSAVAKPAGLDPHAADDPATELELEAGHGEDVPTDDALDAGKEPVPAANRKTLPGGSEWVRQRLLAKDGTVDGSSGRSRYESNLEVARRLRRTGNKIGAIRDLVALLQSAAPNDVKRPALLEMAAIAEESGQVGRAQQILSQYTRLFSQHSSVVEVFLRQGILYREMGATELALAKFHSVFSSALSQRFDQLDYYRRMVLQAQTEIADTYYLGGRWDEARQYFQRVLRLDAPRLTMMQVHYKLVRTLSELENHDRTAAEAKLFLEGYPDSGQVPEVRFVLATALKKLGQNNESLEQVLQLLAAGKTAADQRPEQWMYWQKRAGNDIANQLYAEGDYVGTLEIYRRLSDLDRSVGWQLPVWYQIGLVYERLEQSEKARETYDGIVGREEEVKKDEGSANLMVIVEMARWRRGNLAWMQSASTNVASLRPFVLKAQPEFANGQGR
ncbi:MAG: tetratricopeptide repeat protein [Limisphaerales bacterium]